MIALDTNVLVRIVVDDAGAVEQTRAAREIARKADRLFIAQVVQAELVWVLETAYRLDKAEVIKVLESLLNNQIVILQERRICAAALVDYRDGAADFADYLILHASIEQDALLMTFDKRLAKSPAARLLAG